MIGLVNMAASLGQEDPAGWLPILEVCRQDLVGRSDAVPQRSQDFYVRNVAHSGWLQ